MINRTEYVMQTVAGRLLDAKVICIRLTPDEWVTEADEDPTNMHKPYGWGPVNWAVDHFVMKYCPEIIVAQTADLSKADLEAYLDVIHYQACHEVINFSLDPYERQVKVEEQLLEAAPGSLGLLTKVQLAILDQQ